MSDKLQAMISIFAGNIRKQQFNDSDQLSLGELIKKLEFISHSNKDEEPWVVFDFADAYPIGLSSYRGYYDELAINYGAYEYDDLPSLRAVIKLLKEALGKIYTGWKGGEYKMDKDTPLWVANDGGCTKTMVTGVIDDEYRVVIMTTNSEY